MILLLRLYYEFFKTGLFAVGGGLATLPFLSDMAERTGWFTQRQLADMIAVSESTPGPIGVNSATYVGYTAAGIPGAVIATLGLISPSILIILAIAAFLRSFQDNRFVVSVFRYLRPASVALITAAGLSVAKIAFLREDASAITVSSLPGAVSWKAVFLAAAVFILSHFVKKTKGIHPIVWIGLSAVFGILFF